MREVVGSNPTPTNKTKLGGAVNAPLQFFGAATSRLAVLSEVSFQLRAAN
jgi:hypothetical protein